MPKSIDQNFIDLIRISIGTKQHLDNSLSAGQWSVIYQMAKDQSLVGICFAGVQRLVNSERGDFAGMSEMQYLTWMGMAAKIQQRNELMNAKTKDALNFFREKGFPCYVLKGQGIANLYGSLAGLRQSGDIDVWLNGGREKVYQLSMDVLGKITGANYHHIHFPMWDDPEIEAHIYPSFLSSPFRNRQLHRFCQKYVPDRDSDDFPSLAFNRVFIMLHCYRHLCGHGVGLRQVMDYYFVLNQGFTQEEKEETILWCRRLGMERFAGAMMWVLQRVFGLHDELLICEPDSIEGKFLLSEIMQTGNMGHSDNRFKWGQKTSKGRFLESQKRNLHLMTHYPHEVCWSPFFNIVLFVWRKYRGLIDYD